MPLDFADFAHHYDGSGMSDDARRIQFDALNDFVDCLVRLYWPHADGANALGITLDNGALSLWNGLESTDTLTTAFNRNAPPGEARKKES